MALIYIQYHRVTQFSLLLVLTIIISNTQFVLSNDIQSLQISNTETELDLAPQQTYIIDVDIQVDLLNLDGDYHGYDAFLINISIYNDDNYAGLFVIDLEVTSPIYGTMDIISVPIYPQPQQTTEFIYNSTDYFDVTDWGLHELYLDWSYTGTFSDNGFYYDSYSLERFGYDPSIEVYFILDSVDEDLNGLDDSFHLGSFYEPIDLAGQIDYNITVYNLDLQTIEYQEIDYFGIYGDTLFENLQTHFESDTMGDYQIIIHWAFNGYLFNDQGTTILDWNNIFPTLDPPAYLEWNIVTDIIDKDQDLVNDTFFYEIPITYHLSTSAIITFDYEIQYWHDSSWETIFEDTMIESVAGDGTFIIEGEWNAQIAANHRLYVSKTANSIETGITSLETDSVEINDLGVYLEDRYVTWSTFTQFDQNTDSCDDTVIAEFNIQYSSIINILEFYLLLSYYSADLETWVMIETLNGNEILDGSDTLSFKFLFQPVLFGDYAIDFQLILGGELEIYRLEQEFDDLCVYDPNNASPVTVINTVETVFTIVTTVLDDGNTVTQTVENLNDKTVTKTVAATSGGSDIDNPTNEGDSPFKYSSVIVFLIVVPILRSRFRFQKASNN